MANSCSEPFAYLHRGADPVPVPAVAAGARPKPLPDELIVPPGVYSAHGKIHACHEEGLYRFFNPGVGNIQRVVYQADACALMSGLCWLHTHGGRDDFKTDDELCRLAMTGKLVMTCGPFSNFMTRLLAGRGVRIRVVEVKTLLDRNGYNDGHVLTEVNLDGRWIVFDPDPHLFYRYNGRRLNLPDLVRQVRAGDYEREPLARAIPFAMTDFKDPESGYDYALWYETASALGDSAFRRVMMIPIIPDGGARYYTTRTGADQARAEALWSDSNMRHLPPDEFQTRFYI